MKSFIASLFIICAASLGAQDAGSIVRFDKEVLHLGNIQKGDKVSSSYSFTNISNSIVEIDMVSTCECTEAKWTIGPIRPGDKGKVDIIFDSGAKDIEKPIDVDVYFKNRNPITDNPYSIYLQYTFEFAR